VALIVRPGRRLVGLVALLVALTVVQAALPSLQSMVPALAALHVVNAAALLGLAGLIARGAGQQFAERNTDQPLAVARSPVQPTTISR
jgi:hypothetical protein